VAKYHTRVEARSAQLFATAARAKKLMDRQNGNGPMPGKAYVYGDKERTWDNTQALIDWAEGRPHTRKARKLERDRARGMPGSSSSSTGKLAPSLLEQGQQSHRGSSNSLLRRWRMKMQDKVDAQEDRRRAADSFDDNVARVQDAMNSLPLSQAHRTADVIVQSAREEKGSASGALSAFIATRGVARKLKSVAQSMTAKTTAGKKGGVIGTKFLESGEHARLHARAKAKAKTLQALSGGGDQTCVMCLYFMEKLEQKVGFPSHDQHNDGETNVQDSGQSTYPGPAQYETGMTPPNAPLTNAIPGPGYSSGTFVQVAESAKGTAKAATPTNKVVSASALVSPGKFPVDYETLVPPKVNLATRLTSNYNNEPREHAAFLNANARQASVKDKLNKLGMDGVEFLDTGRLQAGQVGAGIPVGGGVGGGRRRGGSGRSSPRQTPRRKGSTEDVLTQEYSEAHHPYLGMRPEDSLDEAGGVGASSEPAEASVGGLSMLSLLQLRVAEKDKSGHEKGFVDSVAGMAAGAAQSMGVGIKCPEGMPFCRKAIRRIGRRSMARRERRAAKDREMSETVQGMNDALTSLGELLAGTEYAGPLGQFSGQISKIASEYLHDYSDEEICVDIRMCTSGLTEGSLPIAKSAFDPMRL
jgi:hypothetical protein